MLPARLLVKTDAVEKADLLLVLAGGTTGDRIVLAGQMVRQGLAPVALVSGPWGWYDMNECDAAVALAARRGFPRESFVCVPHNERSTKAEARVMLVAARQRGAHRILVVTSDYHSRRARKIYRALAPDLDIRVTASPNGLFPLERWWVNREGRKIMFLECVKTCTEPFGI